MSQQIAFRAIPHHGIFAVKGPGKFYLWVGDDADLADAIAQTFCAAAAEDFFDPFTYKRNYCAMVALRKALLTAVNK